MSAEPQASPEGGAEPPAMDVIRKLDDITVGMRVEAKDSYGKWFRAKVVEKDEETGEVVVHFDGWSSRYDELIHIGEGRLRPLSQEQLQKASRTCKHKPVGVGDRVQARWHDGRMYYGRVLKLLNQMAVVLFDDGVEYTAPINAVRKRKVDPSPVSSRGEGSSQGPPGISQRKRRLIERRGREDSASQPSTSPPSSPLFAPKRIPSSRSNRFWETDESSCTESDEGALHHNSYGN
ncbi:PHD finger protein 20-like protein 1 [Geodia barretti]|uniref:PHD finger protein 20-like protein 1 n=1 Tax=Geodia barretti TaxID=519541 RepID=A0AA35SUB9_GEOBA|nr:PHD finger protein 20-like protein 1 [Geodia barretti]